MVRVAWAQCACVAALSCCAPLAPAQEAPATAAPAAATPPAATPPAAAPAQPQAGLPAILVDRDNVTVDRSCTLVLPPLVLHDADGNGIVHITAPGVTVDLGGGTLRGATDRMAPESIGGTGIRISAPGVTVRNGVVLGFKVGVLAEDAEGTTLADLDVGHGFRQRLASDPWEEDSADWLWPHANDGGEWASRYGAAAVIRRSPGSVVRGVRVRHQQNGILLERADRTRVHDCDASFLSGWGIALWRTSDAVICRNAADFCVRGYSHGRYSRGQDSAGILLFEQCSRNVIALNSATHCGDGIFIFAGREALGEAAGAQSHAGLGCNDNLIALNDLSDAVAHGVEATFSFRNRVLRNRIDRAAICGVWGGYSRDLAVAGNLFRVCGVPGAGSERGGVNVEHGSGTSIEANSFEDCAVGVRLWTDSDPQLAALPWTKANAPSAPARIESNRFLGSGVGIELRDAGPVRIAGNECAPPTACEDIDASSAAALVRAAADGASRAAADARSGEAAVRALLGDLPGSLAAVRIEGGFPRSARESVAGRESIIMTPHGPWDFQTPTVVRDPAMSGPHRWRLLGPVPMGPVQVRGIANFRVTGSPSENYVDVFSEDEGTVAQYELGVTWGAGPAERMIVSETFFGANWQVRAFPLEGDPVADRDAFERSAAGKGAITTVTDALRLPFGMGGPSELRMVGPGFPTDRFGLRATTTLTVFPGCWTFRCVSDDAVRILLDGKPLIEDWTRHGARLREARISVDAPTVMRMQVDFAELDGAATLDVTVRRCPDAALTPPPAAPTLP